MEIYIAPLQDPYSEALPTQAKRKRTALHAALEIWSLRLRLTKHNNTVQH